MNNPTYGHRLNDFSYNARDTGYGFKGSTQTSQIDHRLPTLYSPNKGIVGLRNLGNTCFMNATLQCLLNSPGFADYFESEGSYISSGKYGLARSFAGLVKDARKSELKKLSPSDVKSAASLKSRIFGGYGQQDAHEFLVHFLEAVSIDVNRVKGKPKYVELDYHHNRSLQQNVISL